LAVQVILFTGQEPNINTAAFKMESHLPEYIQSMIRIAPCAMAVVDTNRCYIAVSEKWMKQFGVEEDLSGKSHDAFFPEKGGQWAAIYQDALLGKSSKAEENTVSLDGRVQYLKWEVQPWYNQGNEIGGLVIYMEDPIAGITREQRIQLLNSEIKYRSTIENSLYGVLLTIPYGHVVEANQAALEMFGYSLEEFRKVCRHQIFDVNDPALQDFLDRRARDGRARAELTGIRKNGEHFPCEISSAMFDDIEGKKLNSLVIIDITERKLAEEKMKLSEAQFREAFEYSAIGMALFGLDGKWKRVNRQLCSMLGYTEQELMQLRFQDITHPDDVDRNLELLRNLIEDNGNGYHLEKRYIHKNGCVVWVLLGVSLIRDAYHNPLHCISQIQDITKTKEAEYALAVSEEKYRKIFENIQDIYYRTDVNGIVTEISPSVEKYYNYKRKDIIGSPVTDFYYYKEDQEKIMAALKADHAVIDFEVKLRSNTSELLYASVNSRLVFENEMIMGTEGVIRDISIRKLQENELTSLNTELTALNKHKEKLLSIIGHDLRNPMANTLKLAELALMDTHEVTKEELIEYLTKMSTGLINANELLEDLLYWAKSRFDSLAFNPVPITDIKKQVDTCLKKVMPMAETKRITLKTTIKPGVAVTADKDMLDAIIRNLVSNAIKFTANGGAVVVSAERRKKDIRFAVTDTGSGMSEKITHQLFNKGFSHTTYGTSGEKGTGLGLDLCRDFVEKHQGKIWVESIEGQGSTFYFTLPRHTEESPVD
jgi:PAS domain S-box-containing protein